MNTVTVRQGQAEEVGIVQSMLYDMLAEDKARDPFLDPNWMFEAGGEAYVVERLANDSEGICLVAEDNESGQIVGTMIGRLTDFFGGRPVWRAEAEYLFVRPEQRGNGTGTKLAEQFLFRARELGASVVTLEMYNGQPKLQEFYEKLGFTSLSTVMQYDVWRS